MKKLKLNVDELVISAFETVEVEIQEGTVEAFAKTKNQYTCDPLVGTCFGYTCIDACF